MHFSRKILNLLAILTFAIWLFVLTSCRGDEVIYPTIGTHITDEVRSGGLYILCEGNMGSNKARLDYLNLATGTYYSNWYGGQNPTQLKELGDVGNDIAQYGGKLYAVINCSHKLEVMDSRARHIGQVEIPNCRYITFYGGNAYVSAYVGSVADSDLQGAVYRIDTASLQITGEVKVGHQPDELCVANGLIYVCNSGGYLTNRYDSTISVIDPSSMTELRRINVGLNPTRIRTDDAGKLWVCCQGDYKHNSPQVIVLQDEEIVCKIDMQCANISILNATAYILNTEDKKLMTISTIDYQIGEPLIALGEYENPYGLLVTGDAIYITDAKNYVTSGVLHCYSTDGTERWQCYTGDIPGHLCRVSGEYDMHGDTPAQQSSGRYIARVYEYVPAMGQFVNVLPKYEEGDDAEAMCRKCEQAIANNAGGMICLGGWGGYVTFGFDHPVQNKDGRDLQILGNAFLMSGNEGYGSSEPGIVMVSRDENANGLPDDKWFELKGSMYDDPTTLHHYSKTYTRAEDTIRNTFHKQPYYPQWIKQESITFTGSLLAKRTEIINGQSVQRILDFGYADNKPNTDIEGTSFDISWAVDADGQSISLPCIDFVRVYTAVDENNGDTGELSTEISGAIDLHYEL